MPNVNYVGVGHKGGGNGDLEAAKTEALQLANAITRAKLERLRGDVVGRKEIQFTIGFALTRLRENVLRLPNLVSAELRGSGIDHVIVHGVRLRVDARIRRALEELAEALASAVSAEDFLARMNGDDAETADAAKIVAERKRDCQQEEAREIRRAAQRLTVAPTAFLIALSASLSVALSVACAIRKVE
jgi:hypothetical protein